MILKLINVSITSYLLRTVLWIVWYAAVLNMLGRGAPEVSSCLYEVLSLNCVYLFLHSSVPGNCCSTLCFYMHGYLKFNRQMRSCDICFSVPELFQLTLICCSSIHECANLNKTKIL